MSSCLRRARLDRLLGCRGLGRELAPLAGELGPRGLPCRLVSVRTNHERIQPLPNPLLSLIRYPRSANVSAQKLDPDTGGYLAFDAMAKALPDPRMKKATPSSTDDHRRGLCGCTETPCTAEFAGNVQALQQSAAMPRWRLAQDYATRWSEETPPTRAECQSFIDALLLSDKWGMNTGWRI